MMKYALLLPLVILSFLLGYFASNSQKEQVYAIGIITAVFVTTAGYMLFVKRPNRGDRNQTKKTAATTLLTLLLFSALTGTQFVKLAEANPVTTYSLTMPEEYINYTICWVNGSLWAKVDGTYPISKVDIECQSIDDTWFTFSGDTLPMVYPTPPGTTNLSAKMDKTELEWSNYTQTVPDALHYTAVGNWPIISCTLYPILDQFTLKIHYEHPIMMINGSRKFLYDLNISPYLSQWSNISTAHFTIRFETGYTDLQAETIASDGTFNHVEYTATKGDDTETLSLQVVSEYNKPLPGDLIISFKENKEAEQTNSGFLGSSLLTEYGHALVAVILIAVVTMVSYLFLKRKKLGDKK